MQKIKKTDHCDAPRSFLLSVRKMKVHSVHGRPSQHLNRHAGMGYLGGCWRERVEEVYDDERSLTRNETKREMGEGG